MASEPDRRESAGLIAIDRAVAVIEALRQKGTATLAELSRATALSEPTTLRYLTSLRKHHIVTRDPQGGTYHLGVRLFDWGRSAPAGVDPRAAAELPLARLAALLGETVEMAGIDGRQLVVLAAQPGVHAVSKVAHVGEIEQWHATSVGKALLAAADPAFVDEVLAGAVFTRFTPSTRDSQARLRVDLEQIRERGYALDDEESERGLRCVGVAFRDRSGQYRYAVSASGPAYRMSPEREGAVAEQLRVTALEIEQALGLVGE